MEAGTTEGFPRVDFLVLKPERGTEYSNSSTGSHTWRVKET